MLFATRNHLLILGITFACATANAAPRITNINVRGLQAGGTTRIVVSGSAFTPDDQVVMTLTNIQQQVVGKPTASSLQVDVTLPINTPAGIYHLRVANKSGISNAIAVGVDGLRELPFSPEIESLPVSLTGNLTGNNTLQTKFVGVQGERIAIDCEAQRLGSKLRPVLRLLDSRGVQVAWNSDEKIIARDARIQTTLPRSGTYTIELHDKLYRGAGPGHFRLKVGRLAFADLAFPLAVQHGNAIPLRILSTVTTAEPRVIVDGSSSIGIATANVLPPPIMTGGQPRVVISDHVEVVEAGQANKQVVAQTPVGINGIIAKKNEVDTYLVTVKPGSKLRFDVLADRAGSPLDGILIIRNEQGGQLARNDDRPTTPDPSLDYTVPAKVNKIVVAVTDLRKQGGENFAYRVAITETTAPDFSLTMPLAEVNVPAGGRQLLRVNAVRAGYRGPIKLQIDGLPKGVTAVGTTIPANETMGLVTLSSSTSASHAIVSVVGQGDGGLARTAMIPEDAVSRHQPWMKRSLALGISTPTPFKIAIDDVSKAEFIQGLQVALKVSVKRHDGVKGDIRLRLVANQAPQKKTVKENNKDVQKDAPERMLASGGDACDHRRRGELATQIVVPVDLPAKSWNAVVVAELLSPDKKRVLGTDVMEPFTFASKVPFSLALSGEKAIEARAGAGDTGSFHGKLVRTTAYPHPVTVTIQGLAKEYPAPSVMVPADQSEFTLEVRFPKTSKPADLKKLTLVATAQPDPKAADQLVRSNAIPVTIKVVAEEKAAPKDAAQE